MSYLDLFGWFVVVWAIGFAGGVKFVTFRKSLESLT